MSEVDRRQESRLAQALVITLLVVGAAAIATYGEVRQLRSDLRARWEQEATK